MSSSSSTCQLFFLLLFFGSYRQTKMYPTGRDNFRRGVGQVGRTYWLLYPILGICGDCPWVGVGVGGQYARKRDFGLGSPLFRFRLVLVS